MFSEVLLKNIFATCIIYLVYSEKINNFVAQTPTH
jgi:hypothetical protein